MGQHIDADYVAYGKDSHCHAPVIKDAVHVFWRGAFLYQENRFAYVRQEHPVTHEAETVSDNNPHFVQ